MIRTSLETFKSAVRSGTALKSGTMVHKLLTAGVETSGATDDRQVKFTISTAAVDRDNDTVAVEGWVLDAYKLNPVVLWGHDSSELPIGKCVAIGVEAEALKAVVEFAPADMPRIGDTSEAVLRMCRTGFLSAVSVGFRPLEYDIATSRDDDSSWSYPMNFLRQELMEFSCCSIPANPEALIDPGERRMAPVSAEEQARTAAVAEEKVARAAVALAERRLARLRAYA